MDSLCGCWFCVRRFGSDLVEDDSQGAAESKAVGEAPEHLAEFVALGFGPGGKGLDAGGAFHPGVEAVAREVAEGVQGDDGEEQGNAGAGGPGEAEQQEGEDERSGDGADPFASLAAQEKPGGGPDDGVSHEGDGESGIELAQGNALRDEGLEEESRQTDEGDGADEVKAGFAKVLIKPMSAESPHTEDDETGDREPPRAMKNGGSR